ncbi:MAG: fluoride efflux transporter CrcB [Candidatus Latescibacterota bacterium]|nr:fluoride efflux transporter CrcB [Candidatus Latescibacterota bacterium]
MSQVILVALGGAIGSVARWTASGLINRSLPDATLPYGTLSVNVIGSFAIGFLGATTMDRGLLAEPVRLLLFVGVLGGFTTFSTFSFETLILIRTGAVVSALTSVGLHLVLCLGSVAIGNWLGRALTGGAA